jgi:hypothetical protein
MENLGNEILEMINGLGEERSIDLLSSGFRNMQFGINVTGVDMRLQDYINMDVSRVNGVGSLTKNVIITSPTQVGKTRYIIENCERNKNRPYMFILTCDNSKAQMAQLKVRLFDRGITCFDTTSATKTKIENILRDGKAVVILMLNNGAQIAKLEKIVNTVRVQYRPSQYLVYHDEADMINKADIGVQVDDNAVALAHRRWLSFFSTLEGRNEIVKRFWVTATPENCSSIAGITGRDIVVLPVPQNYVSISENIEWDGSFDALGYEVERIRTIGNGEVILYCVDKKKSDQSSIALEISVSKNCIALCYNSDGSIVYNNGNVMVDVSGDISSILDRLRGLGPIVVVGYNLMNRGISFVAGPISSPEFALINPPPTATVMFYSGGSTSHIVGLAQRFGRICGTSRPDITRRVVYCDSQVYSDYVAYLANQQTVFDCLADVENIDKTMVQILNDSGSGVSMKRPLDRPALKSVNDSYKLIGVEGRAVVGTLETDEDKMKSLVRRWKVTGNAGRVGSLFRRMIASGGKMESGMVRELFNNDQTYNALTSNHGMGHRLVFRKCGRYHYIKQEALDYYNSF